MARGRPSHTAPRPPVTDHGATSADTKTIWRRFGEAESDPPRRFRQGLARDASPWVTRPLRSRDALPWLRREGMPEATSKTPAHAGVEIATRRLVTAKAEQTERRASIGEAATQGGQGGQDEVEPPFIVHGVPVQTTNL
eukprot:1980890-Rhodomonas_salina.3